MRILHKINFLHLSGRTENGTISAIKKKAQLEVITTDACQNIFTENPMDVDGEDVNIEIDGNTQICAMAKSKSTQFITLNFENSKNSE